MNIRIQDNDYRFRVSVDEMDLLLKKHIITQNSALPNNEILVLTIELSEKVNELAFKNKATEFKLTVPLEQAKILAMSSPSKKGITINQKLDNNNYISLSLEVDFKSKPRR